MVRKLIALTIQLETVKKITDTSTRETQADFELPTGFLTFGTRIHAIFDCNFKLKIDSNIEEYIEFAYNRGVEAGIYPKEPKFKDKIIQELEKVYYVHLAVGVLPNTPDKEKQKALITWILLLFAFDNVIDNSDGVIPKNKALLRAYVKALNSELTTDKHTADDLQKILREHHVPEKEIVEALKPIRLAKFLRNQSPAFHKEARKYFESSLSELKKPKKMGMSEYLLTRQVSGAVDSVIRLAEGDLPDYFSGSQVFNFPHMNQKLVLYICLVNDLGGAKEFLSHEPAYLKIQYDVNLGHLKSVGHTDEKLMKKMALEMAMSDLVKLINEQHRVYLEMKEEILATIADETLFEGSSVYERFSKMEETERTAFKDEVRADFLRRCEIRENLAAAGNECTRVSKRYFDPSNPEKNLEITEFVD